MKEGKTAAERDRQRIYRNENKTHNTESTGERFTSLTSTPMTHSSLRNTDDG